MQFTSFALSALSIGSVLGMFQHIQAELEQYAKY
jgi:hypothetical protein